MDGAGGPASGANSFSRAELRGEGGDGDGRHDARIGAVGEAKTHVGSVAEDLTGQDCVVEHSGPP